MTAIVEVNHLQKKFGELVVLAGITFCVKAHDVVVILGPSGCGKTTILRIIAGDILPDGGSIEFGAVGEKRGSIAIVPQRDLLFPWYSLLQNTLLGARLAGQKADLSGARKLLQDFGLEGFEEAFPSAVSGGMRQRVAIARALMANPSLLLLDEGLAQIDFHRKLELESFLLAWVAFGCRAVVAVSHDVETALAIATRVLVLSRRPSKILLDIKVELERTGFDTLVARGSSEYTSLLSEVRTALKEGLSGE